MKLLVFEYITGGGFNKQELPLALANEGLLMLQALLDNLAELKTIELIVMLDWRMIPLVKTHHAKRVILKTENNTIDELMRLSQQSDAVWLIAPECDGILQTLCHTIELLAKPLLTSPASAVAITANKFTTYQRLINHNIATVPTQLLTECTTLVGDNTQEWLIKPIDGVGCTDTYLINSLHDSHLLKLSKERYIIQPHIEGLKTSLSCLFKQGQSWLLTINLQKFTIVNQRYQLEQIIVNHYPLSNNYQQLSANIAQAFPELWGYVGIDLIETTEHSLVLEINPRLTTSFVGIHAALGINVAENCMQLLTGQPIIQRLVNQPITLTITNHDAKL